ncbi:HTH-type transcriptional repressor RghR [compost metagenome]
MSKEFGSYLKSLREKQSLSTHKLAELANVSQSYISHVETGRKKKLPTPEILKRLSGPLKVSVSEILYAAGYITLDEINTNNAAVNQAQSIFNFFNNLKDLFNSQGGLPEDLKKGLREIITDNNISGITESNFLPLLEKVRDELIDKLKHGEPLESYLTEHHKLFRVQYLFAKRYFEENENKISPISQDIRYFITLLIGDRERDFYHSIEDTLFKRVAELFNKFNVQSKRKITVSDVNGLREDIAEQCADMILEVDNAQFHWEVLQELHDIAHEFHIKWNSDYEIGARQPRPKKLEEIVEYGHITYKDQPLEDSDRQRILDMLKLLFPDRQ